MMNQSIAFQVLNGYLSVTALCAAIIFIRYLYVHCERGYVELRPAIALLFLWIGEQVLRGPIFYQRVLANAGLESVEPTSFIFAGGLISLVASLCCIRVFAPDNWGRWSWLGTLMFATVVVGISLVYVYWR